MLPVTDLSTPHPGNIMVVDDNPANLKLLENMLRLMGHEVRSFPRGRLALAEAARNPPDLILLDVSMPEMNGYEVCQHLKSTAEGSDIPVIFLSAMTQREDKAKAFRSGAVDYISKPFQLEEVLARVETHLEVHDLQRELQTQNEHLDEAVAARTLELAAANQRLSILDRSKNEFLKLIAHELRAPLDGFPGRRILSILDHALLLTEIDVNREQFRSAPVSLTAVLSRVLESTAEFAKTRQVQLMPPSADIDLVVGDEDLLVRALHALLQTAIEFSDAGATVRLDCARDAVSNSPTLIIESCGRTIPAAVMPIFFDLLPVAETSTPGRDLGLGPAVAYRILSLFGASVSVANREPPGIRLTVSLMDLSPGCGARPLKTEPRGSAKL